MKQIKDESIVTDLYKQLVNYENLLRKLQDGEGVANWEVQEALDDVVELTDRIEGDAK